MFVQDSCPRGQSHKLNSAYANWRPTARRLHAFYDVYFSFRDHWQREQATLDGYEHLAA